MSEKLINNSSIVIRDIRIDAGRIKELATAFALTGNGEVAAKLDHLYSNIQSNCDKLFEIIAEDIVEIRKRK